MSANNTDVKKFIANYQETLNNYLIGIKYYSKNKQIIEYFKKTIISYKDIIKEFQKKLSQLKMNLMKTFYNNENKTYIYDNDLYPNLNQYFQQINDIFENQINLYSKEAEDIENKILFKYNNKKNEQNFVNVLNQNKNNLQSEEKKIEKSIIEYDNQHKKLMNEYDKTEDVITKYVINKRENGNKINTSDKKKNKNIYEETLKNTLYDEIEFKNIQIKYENNNNNYFKLYDQYMDELEKEISKNSKYLNTDIKLFLSIIMDNYDIIYKNFNEFKKDNNISEDNEIPKENLENLKEKEIKEDFILYKNKNYKKIERKFTKEKYKVRAINETYIDDGLEKETKIILNNLSEELDLDMYFEENPIVLIEEDVYEITEKFYKYFQFVDKSKYNLEKEKEIIRYKKLTQRLLAFGYKKKNNNKELANLKELSDDEIKYLLDGLKTKEYRLSFLRVLNNFRSLGFYEIPQKEFDIISNSFKIIADSIAESEEIDLKSTKLLLILAQTFFINKDNEKHYLNKDIINYKLFKMKKFWEIYLKDIIDTEIKRVEENKKKNNIKMNEKSYSDIIFAHILPFSDNLTEFGMEKDTLMEIITPYFEKYNIPKEMKEIIKGTINK